MSDFDQIQMVNFHARELAGFHIRSLHSFSYPTAGQAATEAKWSWLTDLVLEFNNMIATASWMGPTEDGGVAYNIGQAIMTYVECDRSTKVFLQD